MLKDTFLTLMQKYTNDEEYIQVCWEEIRKSYSAESRYYHNLNHIKNMISELNNVSSYLKDLDSLLFSIYYHDIIFDTSKFDNEHRSAMFFEERIGLTDFQHIEKCVEQIELTKEHKWSNDNDINILLDLDLAIFGKSKIEYQSYCQSIRKEYYEYSKTEFNNGRRKVLTKLLELPSIYKTDYFKVTYEEKARINLTQELKFLD
jgi:predicted metal-dependent HD superfamily phosphohydrolase